MDNKTNLLCILLYIYQFPNEQNSVEVLYTIFAFHIFSCVYDQASCRAFMIWLV